MNNKRRPTINLGVTNLGKTRPRIIVLFLLMAMLLSACDVGNQATTRQAPPEEHEHEQAGAAHTESQDADFAMSLSALVAPTLAQGERLRVVTTTNLVAEVVDKVGGELIERQTLIPRGVDPHSYTATPQDLRLLNDAHLIIVNGLGLEEALLPILETLDGDAPIVSINAGVPTLELSGDIAADSQSEAHEEEPGDDHDEHADHVHSIDPHTWLDVANVIIWTENVAELLAVMDPAHAADFDTAAQRYVAELSALDADLRAQLDTLPTADRQLVIDHSAMDHFAAAYGFEVIGAIIPASSTMAAPSAQELAALHDLIQAVGVPAIFVSTTVSPDLADQLAQDLGVEVVPLYVGSLGEEDGPAATYIEMMRYNVDAIVGALQP